jgi:hypothetical protein
MDILAHGLWVGLGAAAWHRHRPQDRRTIGLAVGLRCCPIWSSLRRWSH